MSTISFSTALGIVTEGKGQARRQKWADDEYICLVAKEDKNVLTSRIMSIKAERVVKEYVPSQEDMIALDWEERNPKNNAEANVGPCTVRVQGCSIHCYGCPYYNGYKRITDYGPTWPWYQQPYIWSTSTPATSLKVDEEE